MKRALSSVLAGVLIVSNLAVAQQAPQAQPAGNVTITGFRDSAAQRKFEEKFLAVPDPKLAQQHLKTLTSVPHMAGTPEDRKTAEYVAEQFRKAGLETRIDSYKVWINYPVEMRVEITAPVGVKMQGPSREQVNDDPFQNDPRVVMAFNGSSPSGDVEAEVVYANYGRPEDFNKLKDLGIDVRGKIVLVRYGANFRGVKSFVAQERGAAGVIIYSDPIDDGYFRGDMYPKGPFRPETGIQRGSIQYMFEYPGDATTPGIASTPDLPDSKRTPPEKALSMPKIPTLPLSYHDAQPIMQALGGPESPRDWQGALPFTYHVGVGPVKVRMHLKQDYQYRTIWNVIGVVRGSELPNEWVVGGNHRDAWVYGAVDPNSGTAAMLETAHGIGELLKSGWKPKRTIVLGSWDAEEQGLIGSTEFTEQFTQELGNAVAYFNMDAAVSGPNFGASAVPSLKQFIRDVANGVPSPKGGSVYDVWKAAGDRPRGGNQTTPKANAEAGKEGPKDVTVGDLGSGSDYTSFLQHLGIPSTDIGSGGPYGVYHSAFDNYAWFTKFGDPTFAYEQEMARIFGIEVLRMADADVLPLDYEQYGKEINAFLQAARKRMQDANWKDMPDFGAALASAARLENAGKEMNLRAKQVPQNAAPLNKAMLEAEHAFLGNGLPHRPFFRHVIFAPGEYTGYAAVVVPGVNEAIDKSDAALATQELANVAAAVNRAAQTLETAVAGQ